MSNPIAGPHAFEQNGEGWEAHNLAQVVWNMVIEQFRVHRQGRTLAVPMRDQGGGDKLSSTGNNRVQVCLPLATNHLEIVLAADKWGTGNQIAPWGGGGA